MAHAVLFVKEISLIQNIANKPACIKYTVYNLGDDQPSLTIDVFACMCIKLHNHSSWHLPTFKDFSSNLADALPAFNSSKAKKRSVE